MREIEFVPPHNSREQRLTQANCHQIQTKVVPPETMAKPLLTRCEEKTDLRSAGNKSISGGG
jgi:hypothetical protein